MENHGAAEAFKHRLGQALRGIGTSQADLATAVNVTPAAVSQWLAGSKTPTRENIAAIGAYLEIPQEWLLFGVGKPPEAILRAGRLEYRSSADWRFRLEPADGGRDYGNP